VELGVEAGLAYGAVKLVPAAFNALPLGAKSAANLGLKGVNYVFTPIGGYEVVKGFMNPSYPKEKIIENIGLTSLGIFDIAGDLGKGVNRLRSTAVKAEVVPSVFDVEVLPYARQRATFIPEVIDDAGNSLGVVLAKNKAGQFISIGGGVDAGETISQAALREAFEESGLKAEQISNFRKLDTMATPEEIQYIYTGSISKETFDKLAASSDVTEFKIFQPSRFDKGGSLLFGADEGLTPKNPFTKQSGNFFEQLVGLSEPVRTVETAILGRFETVKRINAEIEAMSGLERQQLAKQAADNLRSMQNKVKGLNQDELIKEYKLFEEGKLPVAYYIETPKGKLYLAQQSRYNVPGETLAEYFKDTVTKGVYKKSQKEFISEVLGISGEEQINNIIKISERVGYKDYKNPQLIVSGTKTDIVLNEAGELEVIGSKNVRGGSGGLYFQPPVAPGKEGYVGLSYVLGGLDDFELSLLPKAKGKKSIIYGNSVLSDDLLKLGEDLKQKGYSYKDAQKIMNEFAEPGKIEATAKTVYGVETEVIGTPGTRFEFTGEKQINVIGGEIVETKNIRRIRDANRIEDIDKLFSEFEKNPSKTRFKEINAEIGLDFEDFYNAPKKKNIPISNLLSELYQEPKGKERYSLSLKEEQLAFGSEVVPESLMEITEPSTYSGYSSPVDYSEPVSMEEIFTALTDISMPEKPLKITRNPPLEGFTRLDGSSNQNQKKKKKRINLSEEDIFYGADFTSVALDLLEPLTKNRLKEIARKSRRGEFSGFELRDEFYGGIK
jgi:8-oxo-dGTP pyrophosphatase MutT (NUDIX family)